VPFLALTRQHKNIRTRQGIRGQSHQHFTYSFYARRSQKCKKIQLSHKYLFTLLGSASVNAVRRTLMKLSPGDSPLMTS